MSSQPGGRRGRATARLALTALGAFSTVSDLLPVQWRYGYVRPIARRLLGPPPLAVVAPTGDSEPPMGPVTAGDGAPLAVLMSGRLDVGGVATVIETLAHGLPALGLRTAVVCQAGGRTAARLAASGVQVIEAPGRAEAFAALADLAPSVIQLHSAPGPLADAAFASGVPVVPVVHNTEVHHTRADWAAARRASERSHATIAVSELVGEFHARHLPGGPVAPVVVVPNAAGDALLHRVPDRQAARDRLRQVHGSADAAELVLLCMARFDAQKNLPATVTAFLDASATFGRPVRLVVAGDPSDSVETWRTEAVRRAHRRGAQVTLLANSDASTLLAAADAFVLASFFEGWPVAATEAASLGLAVLITDVGGAVELVGGDPGRGLLVSNPAGSAAEISISTIRRARRHLRQLNHDELCRAFVRLVAALPEADTVRQDRGRANRSRFRTDMMLAGHAQVLMAAARSDQVSDVARCGGRRPPPASTEGTGGPVEKAPQA